MSTSQQYYSTASRHGEYQYVSLKNIVNNFMLMNVGDDKIINDIPRYQVVHHAKRAIQELNYGALREVVKMEIELSSTLKITMPEDFVQMTKVSVIDKWGRLHPLIENRITREDCLHYFKHKNVGNPPRSACIMCPYHDNKSWKHLKENYPAEFAEAVEFDEWLRNGKQDSTSKVMFFKKSEPGQESELYVYKKRIPLAVANFNEPNEHQYSLFDDECEGMCGV